MRPYFLIMIICCLIGSELPAQPDAGRNAAEILLAMKKLKVCGSVLYIAAHPDDENTRLLTFLSKEKLYRTAYLSLTRGEGGQNLIGDEQGAPLGLIRTQELLAARRIDGAEQFFTSAHDFGYSKTKEETLSFWNKEQVLKDIVHVIRLFQPQIIIARFPPDKRAGHGHHAASAFLATEAFDAAADPKLFPEFLLKGLKPWKTRQLYWNTYNFGSANTIAPNQLKVDVGGYNSLLGKSYGEIAAESRSQHKSQGFGVPAQRGEQLEYFIQLKGDPCNGDIFAELPAAPDFGRYTKQYLRLTDKLINNFRTDHPERSLPTLIAIYQILLKGEDNVWKDQKIKEVLALIQDCGGVFCEAITDLSYAIAGDSLSVKSHFINRSGYNIQLKSVALVGLKEQKKMVDTSLNINQLYTTDFLIQIPHDAHISQPYWLHKKYAQNTGELVTDNYFPENPSPLKVIFEINIDGKSYLISKPVRYKHTDPVSGERYDMLGIIPPYTVQVAPELILMKDTAHVEGQIIIRKWSPNNYDTLYPQLVVSGRIINLEAFMTDTLFKKGMEKKISFRLRPNDAGGEIGVSLRHKHNIWQQQIHEIKYDHIPAITYFEDTKMQIIKTDLSIRGKSIGYIKGAGDHIPSVLLQMGYTVKELNEKDIRNDLSIYDAVIIGVRAYNVHEWITDIHPLLMQFVQRGGVLLIQYNTSSQVGPLKKSNWPYPLSITRNRVSEENAPVTILDKDHPVFHHPNVITNHDFEGWIQERSVYEASPKDLSFKPLLSMHDQGEEPLKGSLLVADYGKGRIVYTSLSFFRQLPEGVSGAYRLFANLISPALK